MLDYHLILQVILEKIKVLVSTSFIWGCIGAWSNFYLTQLKDKGFDLTLKFCLKIWFLLVNLVLIGGMVALLFAGVDNRLKSFFCGFAALSILEQLQSGEMKKRSLESFVKDLADKAMEKSEKEYRKSLDRLKSDSKINGQ